MAGVQQFYIFRSDGKIDRIFLGIGKIFNRKHMSAKPHIAVFFGTLDKVGSPHEFSDKACSGLFINFPGGSDLPEFTIPHNNDPVGKCQGFLLVVGHEVRVAPLRDAGIEGVEVEPEIFDVRKWRCRVRSNRNVATFIKELVLELPEGEEVPFRAGGYIQIECPPHDLSYKDFDIDEEFREEWDHYNLWRYESHVKEPTMRAYSMANYPEEKGIIMLNVRIATPPPGKSDAPPGIEFAGTAAGWTDIAQCTVSASAAVGRVLAGAEAGP